MASTGDVCPVRTLTIKLHTQRPFGGKGAVREVIGSANVAIPATRFGEDSVLTRDGSRGVRVRPRTEEDETAT